MACDLVIRGGTVLDGSGRDGVRADVAVAGGRIVAVGDLGTSHRDAAVVVDAGGQVVCPGFIDLHSHADFSIDATPTAWTQLTQGVTTLVTGNCGFSPFPIDDPADLPTLTASIGAENDWRWDDLAGFAAAITARRPGVNIAPLVGLGAVRAAVLGSGMVAPDAAELEAMRARIRAAVAAGAVGVSTGLIYPPGRFADADELTALVAEAAAAGLVHSTHIRDETSAMLDAVREAIDVATRAGARLQVSHLKAMGPANHGAVPRALELIDEAAARGLDVAADVYPYTASSTTLSSRLPGWALDGGPSALRERLRSTESRHRMAIELRARFGGDIDPKGIVLGSIVTGRYVADVGRSIPEIARREGLDDAEAVLDVLAESGGPVGIVNHAMAERDLVAALRHPRVAVASDGWILEESGTSRPHPRSFGTFSRVLGRYVREKGVLSLPEAIRRMTSLPADRVGLADRGRIAVGAVADLAVFDPNTVVDRATYEDSWQLSEGFSTVLVAGVPAIRHGKRSTARAGAVLAPSRSPW